MQYLAAHTFLIYTSKHRYLSWTKRDRATKQFLREYLGQKEVELRHHPEFDDVLDEDKDALDLFRIAGNLGTFVDEDDQHTAGSFEDIVVNAYAFGKTPGEAVQFGLNALSHHPEVDYIYFGLGVASMRMGFPAQAEDYFKDAIRFQQWQPAYHANLAIALKERGHWEAAELAINIALELHPDYDFAHNVKAQILKKIKPEQAI